MKYFPGTIFAYGQTSSGKTFTMMGSDLAPGVIPLSMEEVFQTIKNVRTMLGSRLHVENHQRVFGVNRGSWGVFVS